MDQTPDDVIAAITNVRGGWSGEIEGSTDTLGEEFTYRHRDMHYTRQQITELIPGKRVVWRVLAANLTFAGVPGEWAGTEIAFEVARDGKQTDVRFTHPGAWFRNLNASIPVRTRGTSTSTRVSGA